MFTKDEDSALQAVLIRHLFDVHPATLSEADLLRELGDPDDFAGRDGVERAIRELAKVGLVEQEGKRVLPARGMVRFFELTEFMA